MKIDFAGKTVLITGATRGIGKQLADDFLDAGASLILTGTKPDEIENLNRSAPAGVRYLCVNFADAESLAPFLAVIESTEIGACVNNAGINRIAHLEDADLEDWEAVLTVNLTAPYRILRALSKPMKQQRYGRIVNIASVFGHVSRPERAPYTSSKYGLRGLTVTAALELAPFNVLVNSVSPGFVVTDLTRRILGQEEMERVGRQIPIGRLATPADVSSAVLFLASDLNTYITGQDLIVDGGFVNV